MWTACGVVQAFDSRLYPLHDAYVLQVGLSQRRSCALSRAGHVDDGECTHSCGPCRTASRRHLARSDMRTRGQTKRCQLGLPGPAYPVQAAKACASEVHATQCLSLTPADWHLRLRFPLALTRHCHNGKRQQQSQLTLGRLHKVVTCQFLASLRCNHHGKIVIETCAGARRTIEL